MRQVSGAALAIVPNQSAGIAAVPLPRAITDIAPCGLDAERRLRIQYTPARKLNI